MLLHFRVVRFFFDTEMVKKKESNPRKRKQAEDKASVPTTKTKKSKRTAIRQWRTQKKKKQEQQSHAEEINVKKKDTDPRFDGRKSAVYVLESTVEPGRTRYIGWSIDPRHRLREHNGEISGGADETKSGQPWRHIACFTSDPSWFNYTVGRSLEWRAQRARRLYRRNQLGQVKKRRVRSTTATTTTKSTKTSGGSKTKKVKSRFPLAPELVPLSYRGHTQSAKALNEIFWMLNNYKRWTSNSPVYDATNPEHQLTVALAPDFYALVKETKLLKPCQYWKPKVRLLDRDFLDTFQKPNPPK